MAEPKAKRTRKSSKSAGGEPKPAARSKEPTRVEEKPRKGRLPGWLRGWTGLGVVLVVGIFVLFGAYALFVSLSNGTLVEMQVHVGTHPDGTMYMRCGAGSTPGVCGGGDQATFTVQSRDRVHVTIVNDDGGDHTHDIRLQGGPYWLWPAGFEDELTACQSKGSTAPCAETSFTAWSTGSFEIVCEINGHYDAGMRAKLVVQ